MTRKIVLTRDVASPFLVHRFLEHVLAHSRAPLIALGLLLLSVLFTEALFTAPLQAQVSWNIKKKTNTRSENYCVLESSTVRGSDGYQDIDVFMVLNSGMLLVKTPSFLDSSMGDLQLQVDNNPPVFADRVLKERAALFDSGFKQLLAQLEKGTKLTVRLRFWPTWPTTGLHEFEFDLMQFRPLYARMCECS
jgi:hypothetical protein